MIPIKKLASVLVVVGLVALASPAAQAASPTTRSSRGTPVAVAWPLSPTGPQLPTNGTLFGAHIGIDPIWTGSDRTSSWQSVESSVGRKLVIDREYYFFNDQFPTPGDDLSRDQGRTLYLSMTAFNNDGSVNKWRDIANGLYDSTIDARAADIKTFGAPMFFAFHHEPNKGHQGVSAGTPADFIAAWQHIHDRFITDGVTNVSWVLTLMAWTFKKGKADQWYPGDSYVDLIAADGYNWFGCQQPSGDWIEASDIFVDFYAYGVGKAKPMIIAEYGTGEDPANVDAKANWFLNALAAFKGWPLIKAVSYYDSTHGHSDCPRWINTSTQSVAAFTTIGADPYTNPYPMATITSGPADPTSLKTATFQWTSTTGMGNSVTFTCSLDGAAATPCSTGQSYTGLASGIRHLFTVTPKDNTGRSGNASGWEWTISGPVTTINTGPPQFTIASSATFTFSGDQPGYTFTCSIDGGAGASCTSPKTYTGLATGSHTFSVFATDGQGNTGFPATWSWTISVVCATVVVSDTGYSPQNVSCPAGQAVQWNFNGANTQSHSVTDSTGMGLYDSGLLGPNASFAFTFYAAGFYAYNDTNSTLTGSVSVPMTASPTTGTLTTTFTLTWATINAPTGFGYDVQILRPGATKWVMWGASKSGVSGTFVADSGVGTYQFRARLHNQSSGRSSAYSGAVAITVTT